METELTYTYFAVTGGRGRVSYARIGGEVASLGEWLTQEMKADCHLQTPREIRVLTQKEWDKALAKIAEEGDLGE